VAFLRVKGDVNEQENRKESKFFADLKRDMNNSSIRHVDQDADKKSNSNGESKKST